MKIKEVQWLDNVKELISKEKLESDDNISWAAYHASNERQPSDYQPAITSLMPMFLEKAHSAPDSSWYECHPFCITAGKPRTDTCYRNGSAINCTCKADSMAISRYT